MKASERAEKIMYALVILLVSLEVGAKELLKRKKASEWGSNYLCPSITIKREN